MLSYIPDFFKLDQFVLMLCKPTTTRCYLFLFWFCFLPEVCCNSMCCTKQERERQGEYWGGVEQNKIVSYGCISFNYERYAIEIGDRHELNE